jgi:putative acetyltransferase
VVRDYEPQDLDAVLELFQRSVREVASHDYAPEEIAAWAPDEPDRTAWSSRLATGRVIVWEGDGALRGFARLDEAGSIDLLYVHPTRLRRGIARELLAHLVALAREHGLRKLAAEVSRTARPFFERQGFRLIARQTVWRRGVTLENFRMECEVDS